MRSGSFRSSGSREAVANLSSNAQHRRREAAHRGGPARVARGRARSDGRRRPSARRGRLPRLRGPVAHSATQARLRRVRRRDRRADPRPVFENIDSGWRLRMTNEEIREQLQKAIKGERVMLFMKGTPEEPRCGFSARVVSMLDAMGTDYSALDILPDPRIRQELSGLSGWPTIPQLFVKGELVGGCDIVVEMYENGELAELLGVEMPEEDEGAPVEDEPVELP